MIMSFDSFAGLYCFLVKVKCKFERVIAKEQYLFKASIDRIFHQTTHKCYQLPRTRSFSLVKMQQENSCLEKLCRFCARLAVCLKRHFKS